MCDDDIRAVLAGCPVRVYAPVPWSVGDPPDHVITDAVGRRVADCESAPLAELIVAVVNRWHVAADRESVRTPG